MKSESDLENIRKIFPDWPSEFDVAKKPIHWILLAQEYYCSALIIDDEIKKTHLYLHENKGSIITDEIAIRFHGHIPSLFCLSFSIELVIKGAYIESVAKENMRPNEKLDFANHNLLNLAEKITDIPLSEKEKNILIECNQIILHGKYPTSKTPSDIKEQDSLPSFKNWFDKVEPIYKKYRDFVSERHNGDKKDQENTQQKNAVDHASRGD